jgi:broad specificity phosphatase PhoE
LEILNYQAHNLKDFAKKLLKNHREETIVVIGHSNTIPQLINALTGSQHPDLSELEYDWVYFVEMSPEGTPNVKKLQIQM